MRDIKFRAWDLKGAKMYYNVAVWDSSCSWDADNFKPGYETTIMQYTGLKDKNDKEIYEGDVVEFVEEHEDGCTCDHCFPFRVGQKMRVYFDDGIAGLIPLGWDRKSNWCEWCGGYVGFYSPNHEMPVGYFCKVIGNIYETPELLKENNG